MKTAYYARSKGIYHTPQEERDIYTIRDMGFEPVGIHKATIQKAAMEQGMEAFRDLVQRADALFFRRMPDGAIGAGVATEMEWAISAGLPVVELLDNCWQESVATVEQTRARLREVGQR